LIWGLLETLSPGAIIGRVLPLLKRDLIEVWPLKGGYTCTPILPFSISLHTTLTTIPFPSIPTTTPLSSIDLLGLRNSGPIMPPVEKWLRRLGIFLCVAIPPSISLRNSKTLSMPYCLGIPLTLVTFRRKSSLMWLIR
jgi:hypothetical protein